MRKKWEFSLALAMGLAYIQGFLASGDGGYGGLSITCTQRWYVELMENDQPASEVYSYRLPVRPGADGWLCWNDSTNEL